MSASTGGRDDEASGCLHCEINDLVRERLERDGADLADLARMIVESLAEVVLLAPDNEQSKLIADALGHFGQSFLEKSGAVEGGPSAATH